MWKGMDNCSRKWCLLLCTILFQVTWAFWKMWNAYLECFCFLWWTLMMLCWHPRLSCLLDKLLHLLQLSMLSEPSWRIQKRLPLPLTPEQNYSLFSEFFFKIEVIKKLFSIKEDVPSSWSLLESLVPSSPPPSVGVAMMTGNSCDWSQFRLICPRNDTNCGEKTTSIKYKILNL